jgi:hypothetical protein
MEKDHSTPSSHTLLHMAAGPFSSSLHVLTHSHCLSLSLTKHASFIGNSWQPSPALLSIKVGQASLKVCHHLWH